MIAPKETNDEKRRLQELKSYHIMDSMSEEDFDNLTKLASQICGTKVSLVTLLDDKRQWFKSKHGLDVDETPKELGFCGHAIHHPQEIFLIEDARKDERFHDNPLVTDDPNVVFYAGVPLVTSTGFALGTLCVVDDHPKTLNEEQVDALKALSRQAMRLLELRKKSIEVQKKNQYLTKKNEQIERFAYMAAHDLKSPLNQIHALTNLVLDETKPSPEETAEYLEIILQSSGRLRALIDELLAFSRVGDMEHLEYQEICPKSLIEDLQLILPEKEKNTIQLDTALESITVNKTGINAILQNLVTNSIKYSDKTETIVDIQIKEDQEHYAFIFSDNGSGVPANKLEKIFMPLEVLSKDKYGNKGTGFGLAHVKKIVAMLGGSISAGIGSNGGLELRFWVLRGE
ncbi:MAG: ATP-binding protein [Aureispira sp.]